MSFKNNFMRSLISLEEFYYIWKMNHSVLFLSPSTPTPGLSIELSYFFCLFGLHDCICFIRLQKQSTTNCWVFTVSQFWSKYLQKVRPGSLETFAEHLTLLLSTYLLWPSNLGISWFITDSFQSLSLSSHCILSLCLSFFFLPLRTLQ